MSWLKFKIARDISYIYTVETIQIIFVAMEVLFCGEMVILRTLLRICGAGARVRINVQTDCHSATPPQITAAHSANYLLRWECENPLPSHRTYLSHLFPPHLPHLFPPHLSHLFPTALTTSLPTIYVFFPSHPRRDHWLAPSGEVMMHDGVCFSLRRQYVCRYIDSPSDQTLADPGWLSSHAGEETHRKCVYVNK